MQCATIRYAFAVFSAIMLVGCGARNLDVTFRNGDAQLAGTIVLPRGGGPFPAIVFIHGSGPDHRENYRYFADRLAAKGIASLIYDKRGVGGSSGDWRRVDMTTLAGDALGGVALLKARSDIDPGRIGVFGASQGGWIAPLAAAQSNDVAFVVTLGGATMSPSELARWRSVTRVRQEGYGEEAAQAAGALMDRQFALVHEYGWIDGWRRYEALLSSAPQPWHRVMSAVRNGPDEDWFLPYTADIEFQVAPVIERLNVPVLAILGGADPILSAQITKQHLQRLRTARGDKVGILVLDGADHNMNRPDGPRPVRELMDGLLEWLASEIN